MEEAEKARLRQEILDDVGALLREHLAADQWARVLVQTTFDDRGYVVVEGMDVEGVVGDEAAVDAAFGGEAVRELLPVLARATEALAGLEDLDPEAIGGGTFLRQRAGGFQWLPGLVRMPSAALERAWDEVTARQAKLARALAERVGPGGPSELDLAREHVAWALPGGRRVRARATLLGTFARASRTFGWGGAHPRAPEGIRRASAAVVDAITERELWELSTPVFSLDEATARALCAFVCDRAEGQGIVALEDEEGLAFVLVRELTDVPPGSA